MKAAITAKIQAMVAQNRTQVDFLEKFQDLIDEYNAGSANLEAIFDQLLNLAKKLSEESQRHVREEMTEEELAIFDILTKPRVEIAAKEEKQVKKSRQGHAPNAESQGAGAGLAEAPADQGGGAALH